LSRWRKIQDTNAKNLFDDWDCTPPDEIDTNYPDYNQVDTTYNPYSPSYEEPHAPKAEYDDPISPSDVILDTVSKVSREMGNLVEDGINIIEDWV
jgi:hypothetical protein